MTYRFTKLAGDEGGATAIEYGLIAGAAALALLTAYWTFGESLQSRFSEIAEAIGVETQDDGKRGSVFRTTRERN